MVKRIITLVVISSIISAGLLYLGITMMEQYTPALASSLSALVAGPNAQAPAKDIVEAEYVAPVANLGSGTATLEVTVLPSPAVNLTAGSDPSLSVAVVSPPAALPPASVTIAQLFNSPDQYRNQVVTISGMVTSLGEDKILLNDGTGQILVEGDDDVARFASINGLSVTVAGKLDDVSSSSAFKLEACTLEYQSNVIFLDDDCMDEDDEDGMGDDDDGGDDDNGSLDDDDGDDDDDGLDDDSDDDDDHEDDSDDNDDHDDGDEGGDGDHGGGDDEGGDDD